MLKLGILGSGMIVRELMGFIQKLHFEKVYILGRERSKERTEQMVREHHLTGSFVRCRCDLCGAAEFSAL